MNADGSDRETHEMKRRMKTRIARICTNHGWTRIRGERLTLKPPDLLEVPHDGTSSRRVVLREEVKRRVDGFEDRLGSEMLAWHVAQHADLGRRPDAEGVADEEDGEGPGEPVPDGRGVAGCVGGFAGVRHEFH